MLGKGYRDISKYCNASYISKFCDWLVLRIKENRLNHTNHLSNHKHAWSVVFTDCVLPLFSS